MSQTHPDHKFLELAEKWRSGTITESELAELENWYRQNQDAAVEIPYSFAQSEKEHNDRIWAAILEKAGIERKVVPMRRRWMPWVAAAAVLFMVFSLWFFVFRKHDAAPIAVTPKTNDIVAPQTARAQITLANGQIVYLDSADNGMLINQGGVALVKLQDGQIVYEDGKGNGIGKGEIVYNTLANPRGSKVINMTLSDGSKVWLNAGSSIKYPIAFNGSERRVEMTGEAYFEIAPHPSRSLPFGRDKAGEGGLTGGKMPFIVAKGDMEVRVLGTHFNVNAYDDEDEIKVTLLEGSVAVKRESSIVKIKPGQQANIHDSRFTIHDNVDLEATMSWRNDRFIFSGDNIQAVMRQLARWYDVEVSYQGNVPKDEFVGILSRSRNENISAILNMLEKTKTVKFKVEGRKVTVSKY